VLPGQFLSNLELAAGQFYEDLGPVRLGCFNDEDVGWAQKDYLSLRCYPCL
jgi:hypothetical protein